MFPSLVLFLSSLIEGSGWFRTSALSAAYAQSVVVGDTASHVIKNAGAEKEREGRESRFTRRARRANSRHETILIDSKPCIEVVA